MRQELIDYDYVNKLSPEEKEFLNRFTEEYVGGSFKKTKSGLYSKRNLHRTKEQRKECYDRNNARNRDIMSRTKANDMLKDEKSAQAMLEDKSVRSASEIEDGLIALIDLKKD